MNAKTRHRAAHHRHHPGSATPNARPKTTQHHLVPHNRHHERPTTMTGRAPEASPPDAQPEHRRGPAPPDWYERSKAREPERRAARETELRQLGHSSPYAAAIAHAEAGQREWEREERAASRNPQRFYGTAAPETRQTFRPRVAAARTQISRSRERFAESISRSFPGWTPPGTPAPSPEADRAAEAGQ